MSLFRRWRLRSGTDPVAACPDVALSREARPTTEQHAPLFLPPGHFCSPIVDPSALRKSGYRPSGATDGAGTIAIDHQNMCRLFERLSRHFAAIRFPERQDPDFRFWYENEFFSYGDALILAAMIREFRPRRFIEIGSGFSSACALDTADGLTDTPIEFTFVEPNAGRLRSLLRPDDSSRVTIVEKGVQEVDLSMFAGLGENDIVFFDTTHVSKTGSDVNYDVFEILPRLRPGVIAHFHDIFGGWEYPRTWILDDNRSWNEIYLLRAFLMYNDAFEIIYFNDYFVSAEAARIAAATPLIAKNSGGGLWLRRR